MKQILRKTGLIRPLLLMLVLLLGGGNVKTWAETVTYDFSKINDFSSWGSSYKSHTVKYDVSTITFASACKQTQTITDVPVTKGSDVTLVMSGDNIISSALFTCKQWGSKAQTITLHYSTDGGSNYTSTGITATNFSISSNSLPSGTNAVKITFSSTSNQVGLSSATITYQSASDQSVATTTSIVTTGLTNTDINTNTAAGTLTAIVKDASENTVDNATVTWNSSNEDVATIDANGTVTLVAEGTATITASYDGIDGQYLSSTATYNLTVTDSSVGRSSLVFTDNCNGSGTANDGASWTITSDAEESNYMTDGIHYGTGSATVQYVQLSSSNYTNAIRQVVVTARCTNGTAAITVTVGGTSFKCNDSNSVTATNTSTAYTFTGAATGDIVVRIDRGEKATKAIYVKSIVVTYEKQQPSSEQVSTPTFSVTEGTYNSAQNVELSCATDGATIYYTTDGTTPSAESTAYTAAINVSESQTIKAIAIKNGVSSTIATAEYTIIPSVVTTTTGYFAKITSTDDLKDGKYLIVSAASNVAFNGGLAALDAASNTISVDINNDKISASEETLSAAFTIDVTNGTIKNASNKYIGVNTNDNGLKLTDDASTYTNSFAIDENGDVTISAVFAESTMKLRYNNTSGQERFRYFKSTQQAIQLYRYVDVKLNSNGYATFASSTALDFSNASDYTAWQITGISNDNGNYTISFNKITGTIAAGTGILLKGNSNAYITLTAAESGTDISGTNKLVGITEATAISAGEYYGLSGNTFVKVNAGTVPAGKALLPANLVNESTGGNVKAFTFVFNDLTTGVNAVDNGQWTMDNGAIFDLSGRRLSKPTKGINIINGKKVVVK